MVPNGVDVERFVPGPRDDALAASLGIAPDETVIGYISSFTSYEGIRYLIQAAALLRDRGRRIRLLLVGDGEDRADLEAIAHERRTGRWHGHLHRPRAARRHPALLPHDRRVRRAHGRPTACHSW